MRSAAPASASWASVCYGVDDAVAVKAVRRGGVVTFTRVPPERIPAAPDLPRRTAVSTYLPQARGFVRWVSAPLSSARKARRVFPSILDVQLPFALEECVFDVIETRAGDGTTRGLAVGARMEEVQRRLDSLRDRGLDVHVLDHEGIALWTQARTEMPAERGLPEGLLRAVVYVSDSRVTLAVGRGEEFLGAHALGRLDDESVSRVLGSYGVEDGVVVEWILGGPAVAAQASAVEISGVLTRHWPGPVRKVNEPDAFLARSLATRALSPGPLRWNFRRGSLLHPAIRGREERAPFVRAWCLLAAGVLLCVCNLAAGTATARRLDDLRREARERAVRIAGSPRLVPPQQELLSSRRAVETRTRLMEPFDLGAEPVLLDSLRRLTAIARQEGLALETVTITRQTATIRGTAAKWRQCESAVRSMTREGWSPRLDRKGESGDSQVRFIMVIGLAQ